MTPKEYSDLVDEAYEARQESRELDELWLLLRPDTMENILAAAVQLEEK